MTNYSETLTETVTLVESKKNLVVKDTFGHFTGLKGPLANVVTGISEEGVPGHKVLQVFPVGTDICAIYHK